MSLKTSNLYSPHQEHIPQTGEMFIMNPSLEEFKTTYFDDNNKEIEVILQPMEGKSFPRSIGETILNHLMDFVLNQEGFSYKTSVKLELAKIREKCIVYE